MPLGISDNLFKRIVSAVLLLPVVLWPIYVGGWWFAALLALGGALMIIEWCDLTKIEPQLLHGLSAVLMATVVPLLLVTGFDTAALLIGALVGLSLVGGLLVRVERTLGWWLTGLGYVALPLVALFYVREASALVVFWVFLVVWATDVGGYFAGKGIGGPKLAPKISPKKTWAGLLGGMGLSAVVSVAFAAIFDFESSYWWIAGLLAAWAQVGDLLESGIKRSFGVKDSGGLIPGHGGLLDRVDGLVFVAPAVAVLMAYQPLFGFEL
ncbi:MULTISPECIES: phosphatidate cytidylyltransferase [Kordiimonas]|jgi:phosphatidate cytidylyltransferase|uniref:phosphatidate cytidylyltransferase n=1 Tax=Kordiimonas TaxID=288021 RepID=UPI00257D902B|nr:phosphatidate cytidylyltransferase [Kordiimonas sp. UBA4487]